MHDVCDKICYVQFQRMWAKASQFISRIAKVLWRERRFFRELELANISINYVPGYRKCPLKQPLKTRKWELLLVHIATSYLPEIHHSLVTATIDQRTYYELSCINGIYASFIFQLLAENNVIHILRALHKIQTNRSPN